MIHRQAEASHDVYDIMLETDQQQVATGALWK